ncbi:MAG: hypothetical protein RRB13_14795 [bacterium]|nr:hypothetical protein [bacterium]
MSVKLAVRLGAAGLTQGVANDRLGGISVTTAMFVGAAQLLGQVPKVRGLNPITPVQVMSDAEAMQNDWSAVGTDIGEAMHQFSIEDDRSA